LYVGGSGPNNYTKIQDAIDNASDGDIIFVYSGVYYENIVINKSINLIGEDKDTTIIDGDISGDVVNITADWVNIEKLLLKNSGWQSNAGVKVFANNCTVADCNIQNNQHGIYILFSCNNTITECNFLNNDRSIYFDYYKIINDTHFIYSHNNTIKDCYISNSSYGIYFRCSHNNTISNCTILNSSRGIYIHTPNTSLHLSSNNIISNCTILNSYFGIEFSSSSNNMVTGCNLSNNDYAGASLSHSYNNIIKDCIVLNNEWYGIKFFYSNGNTISRNMISNNYYGIYTTSSGANIIYHNNFINNSKQAYDTSVNKWDNGYPSGGNYWSDFDEPIEGAYDNNSDGIVSSPYYIEGGSNVDLYPLTNPITSPPVFVWVDDNFNPSTIGWQYDHFDKIQDAINAVADNGTVYVFNGTYHENLVVDKTIDLVGQNMLTTLIDGNYNDHVVQLNAGGITLKNFYLTHSGYSHAGIYIQGDEIVIVNCTTISNRYGIYSSYSSNNSFENCYICNNSWYGIYFSHSNYNHILKCNVMGQSVGVWLDYESHDNFIDTCNISLNLGHGGIKIGNGANHNIIFNCVILHNNQAFYLDYAFHNTVYKCNISKNNDAIRSNYAQDNIFYLNSLYE